VFDTSECFLYAGVPNHRPCASQTKHTSALWTWEKPAADVQRLPLIKDLLSFPNIRGLIKSI